jgi:hypothetical protein
MVKISQHFEMARAAAEVLTRAKVALQVRQNQIREAKIEANQVFDLAQAGPLVEGAAQARIRLRQIESELPAKTAGMPELKEAIEQAQQEARAAGLTLYEEATDPLLAAITAKLREEILPLADELQTHAAVLKGCSAPLPGQKLGRHDPYQTLPQLLLDVRRTLNQIESQFKTLSRG